MFVKQSIVFSIMFRKKGSLFWFLNKVNNKSRNYVCFKFAILTDLIFYTIPIWCPCGNDDDYNTESVRTNIMQNAYFNQHRLNELLKDPKLVHCLHTLLYIVQSATILVNVCSICMKICRNDAYLNNESPADGRIDWTISFSWKHRLFFFIFKMYILANRMRTHSMWVWIYFFVFLSFEHLILRICRVWI